MIYSVIYLQELLTTGSGKYAVGINFISVWTMFEELLMVQCEKYGV
jgi:hypothetical protein